MPRELEAADDECGRVVRVWQRVEISCPPAVDPWSECNDATPSQSSSRERPMAATHCSASSMQHGAPSSLKPCWECKIRAQLGLDWDTLWKKRRRYPVRRRRLHRVASADLRGSRRRGLQLRPENVRSTSVDSETRKTAAFSIFVLWRYTLNGLPAASRPPLSGHSTQVAPRAPPPHPVRRAQRHRQLGTATRPRRVHKARNSSTRARGEPLSACIDVAAAERTSRLPAFGPKRFASTTSSSLRAAEPFGAKPPPIAVSDGGGSAVAASVVAASRSRIRGEATHETWRVQG